MEFGEVGGSGQTGLRGQHLTKSRSSPAATDLALPLIRGTETGNGETNTRASKRGRLGETLNPVPLRAVETELLALVGELAAGLHQEAAGADELVVSGSVCR